MSLNVKNIRASRRFYEALGFTVLDGNEAQNWLIMTHETVKIGLFQGLLESNMLTFHPPDVREIQTKLKAQQITLDQEAEPGEGPAHIMLSDPDGNLIFMDQPWADYQPNS